MLFSRGMLVGGLNLIPVPELEGPTEASVKIRYGQGESPAIVRPEAGGLARVIFHEPQEAVTPGQAAVFYQGDVVLGGGTILRALD
jgi:tRNA-specific 2-thiouridylase